MKILIILALAVAAKGATLVNHGSWWPPADPYQEKDAFGNYAFSHHNGNRQSPSFHREAGDISGKKVGSYGTRGNDGSVRILDYVADQNGFRPHIQTSDNVPYDHQDAAGVKTTELRGAHGGYGHQFHY